VPGSGQIPVNSVAESESEGVVDSDQLPAARISFA
jgi:hypothetical protein